MGYGFTFFEKSGNRYEGQFANGVRNGSGVFTFYNGSCYAGDFVNGDFEGHGIKTFTSRNRYEGAFSKDERNGWGKFIWATGTIYEGEWQANDMTGTGCKTYANGTVEVGTFQNDKLIKEDSSVASMCKQKAQEAVNKARQAADNAFQASRHPTILHSNTFPKSGNKYQGQWKDGGREGLGRFIFAGQKFSEYAGQFKAGDYNGLGCRNFQSGNSYYGEFKGDKMHGLGVFTWKSGSKYAGEWSKGDMTGLGVMYDANGKVTKCGTFQNDKFQKSNNSATAKAKEAEAVAVRARKCKNDAYAMAKAARVAHDGESYPTESSAVEQEFHRLLGVETPNGAGLGSYVSVAIPKKETATPKAASTSSKPVRQWTADDVSTWLGSIGLSQYASKFTGEGVDGPLLVELNETMLREDLGMTSALHIRKFLLQLESIAPTSASTASSPGGETVAEQSSNHVMLSYQWDSQPLVLKIKDALEARGIPVWLDREQMQGNMDDRMAEAVENAVVICPCFTPQYQQSANCKQELQYAKDCKTPIVPIKMADFKPTGWLGITLAQRLYHQILSEADIPVKIDDLSKELKRYL